MENNHDSWKAALIRFFRGTTDEEINRLSEQAFLRAQQQRMTLEFNPEP